VGICFVREVFLYKLKEGCLLWLWKVGRRAKSEHLGGIRTLDFVTMFEIMEEDSRFLKGGGGLRERGTCPESGVFLESHGS
jgi:hypothetical protein